MATRPLVVSDLETFGNTRCLLASWETLTNANVDGAAFEMPGAADRSIQAVGSFSGAAHLLCQGSNDGTTWATLTDPQGNAIDFTAAGIEQIMEITRYLRPLVTSGDGSTDIDVFVLAKRVV